MVSVEVREAWNKRYADARRLRLKARALTAFNANVDYVNFLDFHRVNELATGLNAEERRLILEESQIDLSEVVNNKIDFFAALVHSMRHGKAVHVIGTQSLFTWMEEFFGKPVLKSIGGQAGLMANQLNALGAETLCWPALLPKEQALLFGKGVRVPAAKGKRLVFESPLKAARPIDETKINWIFEYRKGDALRLNGRVIIAPRANRLIIASESKEQPLFSEPLEPLLPRLGKALDVALFSGFHYLKAENGFEKKIKRISAQLQALRKGNRSLLIHFEYVPLEHKELEKKILSEVTKAANSMGLNETELVEVLKMFGFPREAGGIEKRESAHTIYLGAKRVFEKLPGLNRLQIHDLGYNTLLLRKPYPVAPQKVRDACVFAALATAVKASGGAHFVSLDDLRKAPAMQVSETGLNQVSIFESEMAEELLKTRKVKHSSFDRRRFFAEGVLELKEFFAIIVPAPIIPAPKLTVGLGDVFSSSCLAMERS